MEHRGRQCGCGSYDSAVHGQGAARPGHAKAEARYFDGDGGERPRERGERFVNALTTSTTEDHGAGRNWNEWGAGGAWRRPHRRDDPTPMELKIGSTQAFRSVREGSAGGTSLTFCTGAVTPNQLERMKKLGGVAFIRRRHSGRRFSPSRRKGYAMPT